MRPIDDEQKRGAGGAALCAPCRLFVIVAVLLLALWAMLFSHFVPTALGEAISLAVALAWAAAGAAFGAWSGVFRPDLNPNYARMMIKAPALAKAPNRVLLLALLGFWFGFLGAEGGLLEWWTVNMGRSGQIVVHVSSYQQNTRTGCAGLNFREAPWLFRRAVCVRYLNTADAPPRGAAVILHGVASRVGIDVSSFQLLPDPFPQPAR